MAVRKKQFTGMTCIGLGILIIAAVVTVNVLDYYREKELLVSLESIIPKQSTTAEALAETPLPPSDGGQLEEPEPIGIMTIEKITLDAAIVEGTASRLIRTALGHVPGSALPGDGTGNCVIAGHRNYSFGRFFNRLDEMVIGDIVSIKVLDGTVYQYETAEILIVEPTDTSVLDTTKEATLTLITCTPMYLSTHRLIVKCRLIV